MNIYNLTVNQLKQAAVIKEGIEKLNKELRGSSVRQVVPELRQEKIIP